MKKLFDWFTDRLLLWVLIGVSVDVSSSALAKLVKMTNKK